MKRLLDWVFTLAFLPVFGLVMVVFDVLQRLALPLGARPHEIVVGLLQWHLVQALRVCGTRFAIERSAKVRPHTPYILVANHQSMFDIPIVSASLFSNFLKYVAKKELTRGIPSVSFNLRHGGHALIDRADRGQALAAIHELGARSQARGVSVLIYPEGTRARDGAVKEFKPAGTLELLAAAPALPVVPVAVDGCWLLVRNRLRPVPFGTRVRVRIGDPLERRPDEDAAGLLRQVEAEIRATIEAWRSGGARERGPGGTTP